MISLDITVVYQIVLFLILWLVLSRVLFRPYLGLLEERDKSTFGARRASTDLEEQGARLRAQYEQKIQEAQSRGRAMKEAILQEARLQSEQLIGKAREEAAGSLAQVRADVQRQIDSERQLAEAEADRLARDMVSKILGRNVG